MEVIGIDPGWAKTVGLALVGHEDNIFDYKVIELSENGLVDEDTKIRRASKIFNGLTYILSKWKHANIIAIEDHSDFIGAKFKGIPWAGRSTSQSALFSNAYFQSILWIVAGTLNRKIKIIRKSPLNARNEYLHGIIITPELRGQAEEICKKVPKNQRDNKIEVVSSVFLRTGIWVTSPDIADAVVIGSVVAKELFSNEQMVKQVIERRTQEAKTGLPIYDPYE